VQLDRLAILALANVRIGAARKYRPAERLQLITWDD
jgi:hypothetical protein